MSTRYKNPPLLYVKSRIWWHIYSLEDSDRSKMIYGMLYPQLIKVFPDLVQQERYSVEGLVFAVESRQVVIQLSQDSISVISTDGKYEWKKFKDLIDKINAVVTDMLFQTLNPEHIHTQLEYYDFFKLSNKYTNDPIKFFSEYLKLNITNDILKHIDDFELTMSERFNDGKLIINYSLAKNPDSEVGAVVKYVFDSNHMELNNNSIDSWYETAHDICKEYFEKMISGELENEIK